MNLISVSNIEHPSLAIYRNLRDNFTSPDNSFIADSPKVVNRLLQTDLQIKSILATQEYYDDNKKLLQNKNIPSLFVAEKLTLKEIVGHNIHHGVMMHGIRPSENPLENLGNHVVMLEKVTKNENVGAIARSAAGFGVDAYVVPKQGPHPYARRALRVSMGNIIDLQVHTYGDIFQTIDLFQTKGYKVFAAEVSKESVDIESITIPEKWVLLLGHEGKGLSPEVLQKVDNIVQIEMERDINSLNVGMAASILMYRFWKKNSILDKDF